jgi:hypothetical protein
MLNINFYPDSDKKEFIQAAQKYQQIWDAEKSKILQKYEELSGLKFKENQINAIVFEGVSGSHPLRVRSSLSAEAKLATLIHELGHRLIFQETRKLKLNNLEEHKILNLLLFDVWRDLYGKLFADRNVDIERQRQTYYKEAWLWALSHNRVNRTKLFRKLMGNRAE